MLVIPSFKKKTRLSAMQQLQDPSDLYLSLEGYSVTLDPCVEIGDKIKKYQLLATAKGTFASTLHAPVSGVVKALIAREGKTILHLENDYQETEMICSLLDVNTLTLEDFEALLLNYGIQGAGGSQFPTHLKYKLSTKQIDTLILNGAECEPYLSADFILMKEKAAELLKVAHVIQRILGAKRIVLAIEKQNSEIRKIVRQQAQVLGLAIDIKILPNSYPQGGELQLIKSVTGKEIYKGSLPADYGCIVNNVGTLWAIYKALFEGKPYIERIVTISGDKGVHRGNYIVKNGTSIAYLLNATGNIGKEEKQNIILGGAMMGKPIDPASTSINKGSGGVLLLKKHPMNQNNCIKCGLCVDVCPQRLMPLELVKQNQLNNPIALQKLNLQDCIACGACAYVCPSDVPLMEHIFEGKAKLLTNSIQTK